jgi:hypothetical protein
MSRIGKKEYKVQEEGGKGTRARYSIPHTVGHDIDSGIGLSITIDKLRRCQQRVLIRRGCVLVSDSGTAVDSENVPIDTFSSLDTFSDSTHFPTHEIASVPIVAPSGSQTFTRRNLFLKKGDGKVFYRPREHDEGLEHDTCLLLGKYPGWEIAARPCLCAE